FGEDACKPGDPPPPPRSSVAEAPRSFRAASRPHRGGLPSRRGIPMTTNTRSAEASGNDASPRSDLYSRITSKIIADLEQGVRPWHRPWNAGNLEGRVTRPLRFRQARELGGNVRKGEHGELVVYADRIIRHDTDDKGEDVERAI